uniref:Lon proteolytic domain-containing protein n=1 Tax=Plectus sambesii TaxID=2011161 RepID=A0A914W763_9BILA
MFGGGPSLDDTLFQLRFATKQMERQAKKAEKEMNVQKSKVKKYLQQGNIEAAQIYAENAIRKKNEGLNYLRFAGKLDAVSARVQTAATMKGITKQMGGVVKSLEAAMNSMDLEKVQKVMDKFEQQFENLDVHTSVMEGAMSQATTMSAPEAQVTALMKQVADENGLEIASALPSVDTSIGTASRQQEDLLTRRLASLRE